MTDGVWGWVAVAISVGLLFPCWWWIPKGIFKYLPKTVHAMSTTWHYDSDGYRIENKPKEKPVKRGKVERTPFGHVGRATVYILMTFLVIGGSIGAVVGDVAAWKHLHWFYALYITIGLASVLIGAAIYAGPGRDAT